MARSEGSGRARWSALLFYGVFVPVGLVARPLWKRRLGLGVKPRATTYWRPRHDVPTAEAMRSQR